MNKRQGEHADVACNGGIYVIGRFDRGTICRILSSRRRLRCRERIEGYGLVQAPSISKKHWTIITRRALNPPITTM